MRILVANKFWYLRGGLERVMFDEIDWLEQAGHHVAHFSTAHPLNIASPWSDYFVPYLELGAEGGLSWNQKVVAAYRMFDNREAVRRFDAVLEKFKPDIVHAHGIHRQLSPSILTRAAQRGIPVVESLHDFHHVCPSDNLLYRGVHQCGPRQCGHIWYGGCVKNRCVRNSLSASALAAAEVAWQRIRGVYERSVTRFISPSHFMVEQMDTAGWRIPCDVVPNAVRVEAMREGSGRGFLLICRLAVGKGVHVALAAAAEAGVEIAVAGTGPLEADLKRQFPGANFLGHRSSQEVAELVRACRAVIVPSEWFENAPMSVLEPMARGVPVIGSRIGGIPEQITDSHDGLLVAPGDPSALAEAMLTLEADDELVARLGRNARETVAQRFSPAHHLELLLESYGQAVGK